MLEERPVARVALPELGTNCQSAARLASADIAHGGNALATCCLEQLPAWRLMSACPRRLRDLFLRASEDLESYVIF